MTRNLKVLGLAFVAIFAMSAVAASGASAAAKFTSQSSSTTVTGEQLTQNIFSIGSAEVKCNKAHFEGTQSGTEATSISIHPTYTECNFEPFGKATVKTENCNYSFPAATNAGGMAEVGVSCTSGNIKVEAAGCTVTITNNQTLDGVSYANTGSGSTASIDVTATVGKIAYTKSGISCFLISGEGKYTGSVEVKGSSGGSQVGIAWDKE